MGCFMDSTNDKTLKKNKFSIIKNRNFLLVLGGFFVAKFFLALFLPNENLIFSSGLSLDNILKSVNHERSLRNLSLLTTNSKLSYAAQGKTDDMQARHYFAHVDPDGHYIWDRIVAAGYSPYLELGENLAIEFYDTDSLVAAWMNSPTHRANIVNEGFKDQGMGLTFGDANMGQYHSAIANTFGTLITVNKPAKKIAPAPKSASPKPPVLAATTPPPTPLPSALPEATSAPAETLQPIAIRQGTAPAAGQEANFALPPANKPSDTSTPANTAVPFVPSGQSAQAVVGNVNLSKYTDYEISRYLVLVCGVLLLLLMLTDIKTVVENRLGSLDKKVNNLVMLLIALLVIAFMYWL